MLLLHGVKSFRGILIDAPGSERLRSTSKLTFLNETVATANIMIRLVGLNVFAFFATSSGGIRLILGRCFFPKLSDFPFPPS